MPLAEELLRHARGDGGHGAVARAYEHHRGNQRHGHAAADAERRRDAAGDVEQGVRRERDAEAEAVVQRAEGDAAEAVHDADQAHGDRGQPLRHAALGEDIARVRDEAGTEARAYEREGEEDPEARGFEHLHGAEAGPGRGLPPLAALRRQDEEAAYDGAQEYERAGRGVGRPPAEGGAFDELRGQGAEHERARAEAHEQDAARKALLVREAGHDGGYHAVIHHAHAEARRREGRVEQPEPSLAEQHAEQIARAAERAARGDAEADAAPLRDGAAEHAAQAEAAQHDREAKAQLGARPAEGRAEGRGVDAPGVYDSVYKHDGGSGGQCRRAGKASAHFLSSP